MSILALILSFFAFLIGIVALAERAEDEQLLDHLREVVSEAEKRLE